MTPSEIKQELYEKSLKWLETKVEIASKAMKDAQESANSEEKSSAGDKYETGRAMSQNERDMYAKQLAECLKQKQMLLATDLKQRNTRIVPGALVMTEAANYFICISAGNIQIENHSWFVVSPETPIAKLLLGKTDGDSFFLNGKTIYIRNVF